MLSIIDEYIDMLAASGKSSANTLSAYKTDITGMVRFLNERGIDSYDRVTFTDLNAYVLELEKNCASSSVSRKISSIKSFYDYLFDKGIVKDKPAKMLKAPRITRKKPDYISQGQMGRLLDSATGDTPKHYRDKAMLEILYATGIRTTELISLKMSDINMGQQYITICDNGNGKVRMVPFGTQAKKALSQYFNYGRNVIAGDDEGYVFYNIQKKPLTRQGVWKIIKEYGDKCGLTDVLTPQTFRNCFAMHMLENGADLKNVQELLGHDNISTTQVYANYISKPDAVVRYADVHPRK